MKRKIQGRYVSISTAGEKAQAFVPTPLPPRPPIDWTPELRGKFDQALLALGRLDSVSTLLPDTALFLYMYVRKEAVLSSQIEGTQSSFSDLLLHEEHLAPGVPLDDVQEVSNYVAAMNHGLKRLRKDSFPLSLRLIREMHKVLLAKGRERVGPHDFVLIARETAAVELFRIGSSAEQGEYYFWFRFGERGGAWVARHEAPPAGGARRLPIDPSQLLSVLAVCALPDDPTKLPAVALGMNNEPGDCAYVVTLIDRQPVTRRILFRREVYFRWSDTEPRRPYKVNLVDHAGRRVMTAHLKRYRAIDVSEVDDPPAKAPVMPTDIEMVSNPQPGVRTFIRRIHLRLSEMTASDRTNEDKWERSACRFSPPEGIVPVRVDGEPASKPAARGRGGGK